MGLDRYAVGRGTMSKTVTLDTGEQTTLRMEKALHCPTLPLGIGALISVSRLEDGGGGAEFRGPGQRWIHRGGGGRTPVKRTTANLYVLDSDAPQPCEVALTTAVAAFRRSPSKEERADLQRWHHALNHPGVERMRWALNRKSAATGERRGR